ncbi:MAG: DNA-binding protein [Thermodesulfobacteriota bacterium]
MKEGRKSTIIASEKLHIENKTLFVDLRENSRGRFMQIAELSNDRKSTVVIPMSGLEVFIESLQKISAETGGDL